MKRGIFRIIAGIMMILLQLLSNYAVRKTYSYISYYAGFDLSFYIIGIVGVFLLLFGIRAYHRGFRSQLVLHTRSKKLHTVIKWVMFVITVLLFVDYLFSFIQSFPNLYISTFLMILSLLSFAVYLLLYLYKKPCCLLSASLLLRGIAYLYGMVENMTFYLLHLPKMDECMLYVIFRIIPKFVVSILYIIIAVKLYKEKFSVTAIRVLGWIAFAMELSIKVLSNILMYGFYFDFLSVLFFVGLFLYLNVFKINTLKATRVKEAEISSCNVEKINFCRKCGSPLLDGAKFCNKCGTEVITEELRGEKDEV